MKIKSILINTEWEKQIEIFVKHPDLEIEHLSNQITTFKDNDVLSGDNYDTILNGLNINLPENNRISLSYEFDLDRRNILNAIIKNSKIYLRIISTTDLSAFDNIISFKMQDNKLLQISNLVNLVQLTCASVKESKSYNYNCKWYDLNKCKTYKIDLKISKERKGTNLITLSIYSTPYGEK